MSGAITPPAWTEFALCAQTDPELFHQEKGGQYTEAKDICGRCPVAAACLAHVMATEDSRDRHGMWAGTTPPQRHKIAKESRNDCAA